MISSYPPLSETALRRLLVSRIIPVLSGVPQPSCYEHEVKEQAYCGACPAVVSQIVCWLKTSPTPTSCAEVAVDIVELSFSIQF